MTDQERLDTMEMVVGDGIRFLESLIRHYGNERGLEIWDGLGAVLGKEVKGKILFKMLTGTTGTRVAFNAGNCTQAVSAIKTIRMGTGLGLKEAKDAWDLSKSKTVYLDCRDHPTARELTKDLRDIGCRVL